MPRPKNYSSRKFDWTQIKMFEYKDSIILFSQDKNVTAEQINVALKNKKRSAEDEGNHRGTNVEFSDMSLWKLTSLKAMGVFSSSGKPSVKSSLQTLLIHEFPPRQKQYGLPFVNENELPFTMQQLENHPKPKRKRKLDTNRNTNMNVNSNENTSVSINSIPLFNANREREVNVNTFFESESESNVLPVIAPIHNNKVDVKQIPNSNILVITPRECSMDDILTELSILQAQQDRFNTTTFAYWVTDNQLVFTYNAQDPNIAGDIVTSFFSHFPQTKILIGGFNNVPFYYQGIPRIGIEISWNGEFHNVAGILQRNIIRYGLQDYLEISPAGTNEVILKYTELAPSRLSSINLDKVFEMLLTKVAPLDLAIVLQTLPNQTTQSHIPISMFNDNNQNNTFEPSTTQNHTPNDHSEDDPEAKRPKSQDPKSIL